MKRNNHKSNSRQSAPIITSDEETGDTLVIDQSIKKKSTSGQTSSSSSSNNNNTITNNNNDNVDNNLTNVKKQDKLNEKNEKEVIKKSTTYKDMFKWALLLLSVPTLFSMPLVLRRAGEAVAQNRVILYYIWAVYLVIWVALVYQKRQQTTFSSFMNHNMVWLIVALGAFIVLDIPKMIQQVDLRREVLFVWCTITWVPNIILYFFDDTDYYEKEAQEAEKASRKKQKDEEKRAKMEEKRRRRQQERMDRYTPTQRMLLNAVVYFGLALLVALLAWQTYRWYLKTQQNIIDRKYAGGSPSSTPEQEPIYGEFD